MPIKTEVKTTGGYYIDERNIEPSTVTIRLHGGYSFNEGDVSDNLNQIPVLALIRDCWAKPDSHEIMEDGVVLVVSYAPLRLKDDLSPHTAKFLKDQYSEHIAGARMRMIFRLQDVT